MSKIINVILSGGVGSRLWPLSRKAKPKQYLPLFGGKSLFEQTLDRNLKIADSAMLVGSVENIALAKGVFDNLAYQSIVESVPRNTAAAIAFAAFAADPEDVLIVTPSDHLVDQGERYEEAIKKGIQFAQEGYIATFGIRPTYPETGYGYIEHQGSDVLSFREKPNAQTAEKFLEKGGFLWNSGIFCFQAKVFLQELKKYAPEVYSHAEKAYENRDGDVISKELSLGIPSISVDYAVMEKSKKIKVVPSYYDWSDMGSFEALYTYLSNKGHEVDENGNMYIGKEKFHRFLGLKNTILVETDDAILVLNKEMSQNVKEVYKEVEKEYPRLA